MKTILSFIISLTFMATQAQTTATTALLPDQNPNYQVSREKYMAESSDLIKNEGQTVQQTYKAIDDVQAKKEKKELASQRRHERRMARIQSRGFRRNNYSTYDYNNYNNGYYYNGYSNPYGFYHPRYYSNNIYRNINPILNTTLLGLAIWSLLKH